MKIVLKTSISIVALAAALSIGGIAQAKDDQSSATLPKQFQGRWYVNKDHSDEGMGFAKDGWGFDTTGCVYLKITQVAKGKLNIRTACGPESSPAKLEITHIATLNDGRHKSMWDGELSNIEIGNIILTLKGNTLIAEGAMIPASHNKLIFKSKD